MSGEWAIVPRLLRSSIGPPLSPPAAVGPPPTSCLTRDFSSFLETVRDCFEEVIFRDHYAHSKIIINVIVLQSSGCEFSSHQGGPYQRYYPRSHRFGNRAPRQNRRQFSWFPSPVPENGGPRFSHQIRTRKKRPETAPNWSSDTSPPFEKSLFLT